MAFGCPIKCRIYYAHYEIAVKKIILLISSFFLIFLFFEIILRFLPVSDALETQPVNKNNPIIHYIPNKNYLISIGPLFELKVSKKTNNYGYFDDYDLEKSNSFNERVIIIGDSFVEAVQVKNEDTFQGILVKKYNGKYSFNAIGARGASLSQYLKFAKFAKDKIDPSVYIFSIVPNDYDNSHIRYRTLQGFHYFDENFDLVRIDHAPSILKKILREIALARYLIRNLRIHGLIAKFKEGFSQNKDNINVINKSEERISLSYKVIDKFLNEVKLIAKEKPVIFIVEPNREKIYSGNVWWTEYHYLMNKYFIEKSKLMGFNTIDLNDAFKQDYKQNKIIHNSKVDSHWNELGHMIVANELFTTLNESYIKN